MPSRSITPQSAKITVLLVEADILVRFALADYLRACEAMVVEAASADDAKAILVAGPPVDILFSDAQLAGEGSGFVLAQWVRRHRPAVEIILTATLAAKAQAAADFTTRVPGCQPPSDAAGLASRLSAMLAERKRRMRQQSKTASTRRRRTQATS
jgi:DNA-binding NtrC family response regulator